MNSDDYSKIFFDFITNDKFKNINDNAFNIISYNLWEELDNTLNFKLTVEICEELDNELDEEIK